MPKIMNFLMLCIFVISVYSVPLNLNNKHNISKRFVNTVFNIAANNNPAISNIRTKRSEAECEQLQLCKLHARAGHSFLAAYELYFVNKENARLWDHRARSEAACARHYRGCYDYDDYQ